MGDNAQGRDSGTRNAGINSIGSQPVPSTSNFQTMRARARAGGLAGKSNPRDSLSGEQPGQNFNAKRRDIRSEVMSHQAKTTKTGNDPSVKQQPRSMPSAAERYTASDAGHPNPQGRGRSGARSRV